MSSKEKREQRLLLYLSKKQGFVTSEELAELLATSKKTIYRIVKKLNDDSSEGTLVQSEKGRGYKLNYDSYIQQMGVRLTKDRDFSPTERRNRVMEELLLSSPKSKNVYELYEEYYVGDSVISSDEQLISRELAKYDLILERKNRAMAIIGDEKNIREAISAMIQNLNIIDIDELKNSGLNFNNYDVLFILDQLRMMEKKLNIVIPNPYNINIFSHLYILISRARKVRTSGVADHLFVTDIESADMENNQELYQAAKNTIENIEKYLFTKLSESEVYYLFQYLVSSRMQGSVSKQPHFSEKVSEITQLYLTEMSERLNISIRSDTIFTDLANHIKPLLNRLAHKIQIKNSLLEQIKMIYDRIFVEVSATSEIVSQKYGYPEISGDENGFIALYFARIIETNQLPIRTLIMCTTGIGTSELLRVKVAKKFPELEIVDVVATRDYQSFLRKYPDIELILTTVGINESITIANLLVSAMFTIDDQNRVGKKIEEIYHGR